MLSEAKQLHILRTDMSGINLNVSLKTITLTNLGIFLFFLNKYVNKSFYSIPSDEKTAFELLECFVGNKEMTFIKI